MQDRAIDHRGGGFAGGDDVKGVGDRELTQVGGQCGADGAARIDSLDGGAQNRVGVGAKRLERWIQ